MQRGQRKNTAFRGMRSATDVMPYRDAARIQVQKGEVRRSQVCLL